MRKKQSAPLLLLRDGRKALLQRVQLNDRHIQEEDLQQLIAAHPEVLPVDDLDPTFAPLFSLGREVPTDAGFIDNLLMSPEGRITVVEAKLWRNPQATREVVAQVLDYAKSLRLWDYETLEDALARAKDSPVSAETSLYSVMANLGAGDERDFVDAVQRTLSTGRFLLLVVGDGIRENIERLVGSLHTAPDLLFSFGLIELHIFEDELFGGRIVLPQVLAQTTEIVRAVVKIEPGATEAVSITLDQEQPSGRSTAKRRLSEEEFFESVEGGETEAVYRDLVDRAASLGAEPHPGTAYLSLRLRDPAESGQDFTLFFLAPNGSVGFGWFPGQLTRAGYPAEIAWQMLEEIAGLYAGVEVKANEALSRNLTAAEVGKHIDRFMGAVGRAIVAVKEAGR